jgi:superfamily II DNA/RNA helicase
MNRFSNHGFSNRGSYRRPNNFRYAANNKNCLRDIEALAFRVGNPKPQVKIVEPSRSFEEFGLSNQLLSAIKAMGYQSATPIQGKVIPEALNGLDVIGLADTGTGKTAAFLIPLITKILANRSTKALIMAPTRELAQQIEGELRKLSFGMGIRSVLVVGGMPMGRQIQLLKAPHSFVIGTPGRIKDLLERKYFSLNNFNSVVLDEMDRMLDMGFIYDVTIILKQVAIKHQSLFFSATITPRVDTLCRSFMQNPIKVSIQTEVVPSVKHEMVRVPSGQEKNDFLYGLLANRNEFKKVLIFSRTKHGVKRLTEKLNQKGFYADCLHGNKSQPQRLRSLNMFRQNRVNILVATDVAARGIDVPDITHVINYDIPQTIEDYVHRIGRTGRAGNTGIALTFVN